MSEQTNDLFVRSDTLCCNEQLMEKTNDGFIKSYLQFRVPAQTNNLSVVVIDDDGDLDVCRPELIKLTLVHRDETTVAKCGFQLWNGALLLCDYLLTNPSRFLNKTILELGAGVGLCSLVVSRLAAMVICTDHDNDLLELIQRNIEMNRDTCNPQSIRVQKFDWTQFTLNELDNRVEIILAADVVYDDDLTDALFNVFIQLWQDKPNLRSIYITIEKRINFYIETLSAQCPAYEYFLEKLNELKTNIPILTIEEIDTDADSLVQCTSSYKRTKELVATRIEISRM